MAEVTLTISGQNYPIWCDDGQEQRVQELAAYINGKLEDIKASGAANTDNHLLVLTSLILADEVFDARAGAGAEGTKLSQDEEQLVANTLSSIASRIQIVADKLQKA